MSDFWWLILQLASTAYMTGLIWFVQIVHYPLFAAVGRESFQQYEARHMPLTTWVVAPGMLVEAGACAWLAVHLPGSLSLIGFALLMIIWIATAAASVPCHNRLLKGFDSRTHRRLVETNWIRTAAWTGRLAVSILMLHAAFEGR